MPPNKRTHRLIAEALSLRPNQPIIARTLSQILNQVYNQPSSPKQISKYIITLRETHPQIQKTPHTPQQAATLGCRYSYKWDTLSNYTLLTKASGNLIN